MESPGLWTGGGGLTTDSVNSPCLHANEIISPLYRTCGHRVLSIRIRTLLFLFCKSTMSPCESIHISFISNPNSLCIHANQILSHVYRTGGTRVLSIRIRSRLVFCSVNSLCLHANHILSPLHRTRRGVASALYQNPGSISSLCKFNMSSCESEHVSFEDRIPSDRISPVASVGIASEKKTVLHIGGPLSSLLYRRTTLGM